MSQVHKTRDEEICTDAYSSPERQEKLFAAVKTILPLKIG